MGGIFRRLADASVEMGDVWGVGWEGFARRKGECQHILLDLDGDVGGVSRPDKAKGRSLGDTGRVFIIRGVLLSAFERNDILDEPDMSCSRLAGEASGNVELKGTGGVARVNSGGVIKNSDDNLGGAQFGPCSPYAVDDLTV